MNKSETTAFPPLVLPLTRRWGVAGERPRTTSRCYPGMAVCGMEQTVNACVGKEDFRWQDFIIEIAFSGGVRLLDAGEFND